MGACQYCGKSAGWFRDKHKDCDTKYKNACGQIVTLAQETFGSNGDLDALRSKARALAAESFVPESNLRDLFISGFEGAVQRVLEDNLLTVDEEKALDRVKDYFGWSQDDLDRNGAYTNVAKGAVLREVLQGKLPTNFKTDGPLPLNFQKDEQLVWGFGPVKYFEVRTRRSYAGGYQGMSIRVARGVYYRMGAFRGHPVDTTEMVQVDTGILVLTQKHLYFTGPLKSFRIRYDKIVSFSPYSDGVGVQKDAATAKPQAFLTGDGWFTYNLVTNLAHLQAGRGPSSEQGDDNVETEALDDSFVLPAVGESNYQEALRSICGEPSENGEDRIVDAVLILEDSNPYDPQAVRVDIPGKTVGYLSRANARRFRKSHAEASTTCKARIRGGWDRGGGDTGSYGVSLDVGLQD